MIQSDTLSWQLDYIPEQDNNNVDRILLLENMFFNLMDLDLQDRIANMDKYDYDVKNAFELLLENGPNSLRQDLEDWWLEKHGEKNVLFYKDKNYVHSWWFGPVAGHCQDVPWSWNGGTSGRIGNV